MANARKIVAQALLRVEEDGAYSNIVLNDIIKEAQLCKEDASFVSAVFYGVLENKRTIDYYIRKLSSQPLSKVSPLTLQVLRSGIYQIAYMDKVPDSAAVNESVNIIKHSRESRSAGYVNAVLRNASRKLPPLPNGESAKDLAIIFSCSDSLCDKIVADHGLKVAKCFLEASLGKRPLYIRVNTVKCDADNLITRLNEFGVIAEKTPLPNALSLASTGAIENNPCFKEGLFHVQDLSSQICSELLDAQQGNSVLDVCAAPGGKTFTICEAMNDIGKVIACDVYEHRVMLIKSGAHRLGLSSIMVEQNDAAVLRPDFIESFDRVLCDVPCSGSGIIGRKPDIKYKNFDDLSVLNELQFSILENAFKYLKPGGKLVYSTCSILKCENDEVINRFKKSVQNAGILKIHTYLPHIDGSDGFFTAVIEKTR